MKFYRHSIIIFSLSCRNTRATSLNRSNISSDITAYVGPVERSGSSVSARERENDYAVSVKFHTSSDGSREQYVFPLPKDTEFDKLDPNTLASFWDPLQ